MSTEAYINKLIEQLREKALWREDIHHDLHIASADLITKLRAERDAAARDMRERCAKVADDIKIVGESEDYTSGMCDASMFIAERIRALPLALLATEGEVQL